MKIKYFLFTAVLAAAILCSGVAVKAQTVDVSAQIAQLQQQIAQLVAQLQALQAQQGQGQTWCHTFNANLGVGNKGTEIDDLWTALSKEGYGSTVSMDHIGMGQPDTFGENTASGVVSFQAKYGILQTGYVGPLTRAKLNSLYGCGVVPPPANQCTTDSDCPPRLSMNLPGWYPKCVNGQCVLLPPTTCTPNWQCVNGPCVNGYSFSSPKDLNNCNVSIIGQTLPACSSVATSCNSSNQVSIKVTSPNGGESYTLGSIMPITWTSSKLNVGQVAIVLYRYDDNLNQGKPVAVNSMASILVPNTGLYNWTIPTGGDVNTVLACSSGCSTNGAMFKVVIYYPDLVSGNVDQYLTSGVADASDNYFAITGSNNSQCTSLYWIDNTTQNCQSQKQFCGAYMYQGLQVFSNKLDCQVAALQKQLNRTCNTNSDCLSGQVCSGGVCGTAVQPSITVTSSPTGSVSISSTVHITWTSQGISDHVGIGFCPKGEATTGIHCTESQLTPNNGSADISLTGGTNLYAGDWYPVISGYAGSYGTGAFAYGTGGNFTVVSSMPTPQASVTVTSPDGGETWNIGSTHTITWNGTASDATGHFHVALIRRPDNNGAFAEWSVGDTSSPYVGLYSWTIPATLQGEGAIPSQGNSMYKIRVYYVDANGNTLTYDDSNDYFTIASSSTQPSSSSNNSSLTAQRLFPGQYDNTKYSLSLTDPDGLGDIIVKKADGTIAWSGSPRSGSPACPTSANTGTMTFLSSDFPLTGTVVDCKSASVYPVSVQMPVL